MPQLENLEEIRPKFEGSIQEIFDTKFCHMGKGLDPNFSLIGLFPACFLETGSRYTHSLRFALH